MGAGVGTLQAIVVTPLSKLPLSESLIVYLFFFLALLRS